MRPEDLPAPSALVRRLLEPTLCSADFWNDRPAQAHVAGRKFSGEMTAFESRFVRKRMPIYFVALRKR
jgi:hypothetical protein